MTRSNPSIEQYPYDPKIEKTTRRLRQGIRERMNIAPGQQNNAGMNAAAADNQGAFTVVDPANPPQQERVRMVRDYLEEDLDGLTPTVVMPNIEAKHFELRD